MPSQEKKEKVKQIKKWFDGADSLLVLQYKGLTVSEANELRSKLRSMDSELRVLKNTLTRIAVADTPKEGITPLLDGPVAVVFVRDDAASTAKVLRDFARGRQEFGLRGGLLEGRVLDGRQVETFATLPAREVLLAQMAGILQAPLARAVQTVAAPVRKMVSMFAALKDKMEAEAPAPPAAKPAPEPEEAPAETAAEAEGEAPAVEEAAVEAAPVEAAPEQAEPAPEQAEPAPEQAEPAPEPEGSDAATETEEVAPGDAPTEA